MYIAPHMRTPLQYQDVSSGICQHARNGRAAEARPHHQELGAHRLTWKTRRRTATYAVLGLGSRLVAMMLS